MAVTVNLLPVEVHVNRGYLQKDTKLPALYLMPAPLAWWVCCSVMFRFRVPWHPPLAPHSLALVGKCRSYLISYLISRDTYPRFPFRARANDNFA